MCFSFHCLCRNNNKYIHLIFDAFKIRGLNWHPACKDILLEPAQGCKKRIGLIADIKKNTKCCTHAKFQTSSFSFKNTRFPMCWILVAHSDGSYTFLLTAVSPAFRGDYCFLKTWPAPLMHSSFLVLNAFIFKIPVKDCQFVDSSII